MWYFTPQFSHLVMHLQGVREIKLFITTTFFTSNAVYFLKIQLSFYTFLTHTHLYTWVCSFVGDGGGGGLWKGGGGGVLLIDINRWQVNLHPLKFYRTSHHQMSHKLTSSFLLIWHREETRLIRTKIYCTEFCSLHQYPKSMIR